jgi:hypothetical protein
VAGEVAQRGGSRIERARGGSRRLLPRALAGRLEGRSHIEDHDRLRDAARDPRWLPLQADAVKRHAGRAVSRTGFRPFRSTTTAARSHACREARCACGHRRRRALDLVTCHLKSKLLSFPGGLPAHDEGERAVIVLGDLNDGAQPSRRAVRGPLRRDGPTRYGTLCRCSGPPRVGGLDSATTLPLRGVSPASRLLPAPPRSGGRPRAWRRRVRGPSWPRWVIRSAARPAGAP